MDSTCAQQLTVPAQVVQLLILTFKVLIVDAVDS